MPDSEPAVVTRVFDAVAETAPTVRAGLDTRRTYETAQNPTGDQVLAADRYADERFEERLLALDAVASYASEEREAVSWAERGAGDYHVAVDPLDGSSNLKSNNAMGTIVGVYDEPLPAPGSSLVGAAYVLYGPITTMVAAVGNTVSEYVVQDGTRRLDREDVTVPADPSVYGFGGRRSDWLPALETFVSEAIETDPSIKLRYGGAMIADVNQVLTYGGIFGYPALQSAPEGKLRVQFEGNPIGYILEAAGGVASDGDGPLLQVEPTALHQRTPLYVGSESLVAALEDAL